MECLLKNRGFKGFMRGARGFTGFPRGTLDKWGVG